MESEKERSGRGWGEPTKKKKNKQTTNNKKRNERDDSIRGKQNPEGFTACALHSPVALLQDPIEQGLSRIATKLQLANLENNYESRDLRNFRIISIKLSPV
jgi:hypothetical protein